VQPSRQSTVRRPDWLSTIPETTPPLRIGFVNFRRIIAAAPQREEVNERLEREFGVERDALLQAQSELRDMERRLETIHHGDAYNELERQVINKRRDVSRRDSDYRDNINVRRNEEMAKLQKMIGDEILSQAKEAGYDIILNDIGVFYVSERADLVRRIAGETEYTAQDSENARLLTMLHRGLPPAEVTPKKIQSTFWELRNELITTRAFWEEMKRRKTKKKS